MTDTQEQNAQVSAVILAAGTSTRMGQAKQLLPLGGTTVLARTIDNVRSAGLDEIVLVLGAAAEAIRRQLPPSLLEGLKVVVNQAYRQGMASSLREGLSALDRTDRRRPHHPRGPALHSTPNPPSNHGGIPSIRAQIVIPSYQGKRGNPVLLSRSVFSEVDGAGRRHRLPGHLSQSLGRDT